MGGLTELSKYYLLDRVLRIARQRKSFVAAQGERRHAELFLDAAGKMRLALVTAFESNLGLIEPCVD